MKENKGEVSFLIYMLMISLNIVVSALFKIFKGESILSVFNMLLLVSPLFVLSIILFYFFNGKSFKPLSYDKCFLIWFVMLVLVLLVAMGSSFIYK